MRTRKWMVMVAALAATPALAQSTSTQSTTPESTSPPKSQMSGTGGSAQQPMTGASFDDKASQKVRSALEQRTRQYEEAWNAHDVQAMARYYLPDATYLSLDGKTATGREQIQEIIRTEHEGPMRDSRVKLTLSSVREIAPNLAILDVKQTLTGVQQQPGQPPVPSEIMSTVVAKKQGNQWSILALRAYPAPGAAAAGVGGAGQVQPMEQPEPMQPSTEPAQPSSEPMEPTESAPMPEEPSTQP